MHSRYLLFRRGKDGDGRASQYDLADPNARKSIFGQQGEQGFLLSTSGPSRVPAMLREPHDRSSLGATPVVSINTIQQWANAQHDD